MCVFSQTPEVRLDQGGTLLYNHVNCASCQFPALDRNLSNEMQQLYDSFRFNLLTFISPLLLRMR